MYGRLKISVKKLIRRSHNGLVEGGSLLKDLHYKILLKPHWKKKSSNQKKGSLTSSYCMKFHHGILLCNEIWEFFLRIPKCSPCLLPPTPTLPSPITGPPLKKRKKGRNNIHPLFLELLSNRELYDGYILALEGGLERIQWLSGYVGLSSLTVERDFCYLLFPLTA